MTENKELREYIYVDNDAINSLLAQFDEGLSTLLVRTTGRNKSTRLGTLKGGAESLGASATLHGIAKGDTSVSHSHNKTTSQSVEELNQSAESVVNGDFGVEILEDYLHSQIKTPDDANVGDIISFKDSFRLYDFESLAAGTNPELINKVMQSETSPADEAKLKELQKQVHTYKAQSRNNPAAKAQLIPVEKQIEEIKQSQVASKAAEHNYEIMYNVTKYFSKTLPNSVIISTTDTVSFANKSQFRLSVAQLQMLQKNPRPLHILGIAENRSDNVDWGKHQLETEDLPITEIGTITTYLTSIVLDNFGISQKKDSLQVRPIAMYF